MPPVPPPLAGLLELARPRLSLVGTSALLFETPGPLSLLNQQRLWDVACRLDADPAVLGAHLGMNSLLVRYDALRHGQRAIRQRIRQAWAAAEPRPLNQIVLEATVDYGGAAAPDFADLCARTGLSAADVARLHAEPDYVVFAPGNKGGYGYLFGLPETLFMPRKPQPQRVRGGGQVTIGGLQCNLIAPSASPRERLTGWNVIGRAHDLPRAFDPERTPPTLTRPGDRIRFRVGRIAA